MTMLRVVSEPAFEPVTLAEARGWLNITAGDTTYDTELTLLIKAMRRYAENLTGRAFMHRSLQLLLPEWPADYIPGMYASVIELPRPPLVSVQTIQYRDDDGVLQTLASDQYVTHPYREPAIVVPEWQVTWPSVRWLVDAVQVNYIAGYPVSGSPSDEAAQQAAVPESVKLWMHARMATLFEQREQIIIGTIVNDLPRAFVDGLLDELRLAEQAV